MGFVSIMPNERSYILGVRDVQNHYNGGRIQIMKPGKTGLRCAAFNYINGIVGSGVIGIPFALNESGFGMGLLLIVFVACITDYSLMLIIRNGHISNTTTYQEVMRTAFGLPGYVILSILQFLYPFIAMISYNIIVGDTVTKVLIRLFSLSTTSLLARRDVVIGLSTLFVTMPLCMLRDMAALVKASVSSCLLVGFILVVTTVRYITLKPIIPDTDGAWEFVHIKGVIPAFAVMSFGFMCHHNVFLMYESIENASENKWNKLTHWSIASSTIIMAAFGIVGYITFTGYTQGDVLENYCWNDDLINVARLAFGFTILFSFPLECLVARSVVSQALGFVDSSYSSFKHVGITLILIVIIYLISITTSCLGVVLVLNGVVSAVPLAFILPALSYIKLEEGPILSKRKLPALALAIFGFIAVAVGCVLVISDWEAESSCDETVDLFYCTHNSI